MRAVWGLALIAACSFSGPGNGPAGDGDGDAGVGDAGTTFARCGTPGMFRDDFAAKQDYWNELGSGVTLAAGRMVMTADERFFEGLQTRWVVDLTDAETTVEVVRHPAPGEGHTFSFVALATPDDYIRFRIDDVTIRAEVRTPTSTDENNTTLDRTAHRFLKMRESGGQLFFETSPDGASWTTLHQATTPPFADRVELLLGGELVGNTAGAIELDNFNAGVARAKPCASTTMSDGFDDSAVGPQWAQTEVGRCVGINEGGTVIQFSQTAGISNTRCSVESRALYDLSDAAAGVYITSINNFSGDWHTFLEVSSPAGELVMLRFIGDTMCAALTDTIAGFDTCIPYDTHQYWRLRGSGGELHAEASTDGATFETVASGPAPFDLEWIQIAIGTGSTNIAGPIGLSVSDYNVPPAI